MIPHHHQQQQQEGGNPPANNLVGRSLHQCPGHPQTNPAHISNTFQSQGSNTASPTNAVPYQPQLVSEPQQQGQYQHSVLTQPQHNQQQPIEAQQPMHFLHPQHGSGRAPVPTHPGALSSLHQAPQASPGPLFLQPGAHPTGAHLNLSGSLGHPQQLVNNGESMTGMDTGPLPMSYANSSQSGARRDSLGSNSWAGSGGSHPGLPPSSSSGSLMAFPSVIQPSPQGGPTTVPVGCLTPTGGGGGFYGTPDSMASQSMTSNQSFSFYNSNTNPHALPSLTAAYPQQQGPHQVAGTFYHGSQSMLVSPGGMSTDSWLTNSSVITHSNNMGLPPPAVPLHLSQTPLPQHQPHRCPTPSAPLETPTSEYELKVRLLCDDAAAVVSQELLFDYFTAASSPGGGIAMRHSSAQSRNQPPGSVPQLLSVRDISTSDSASPIPQHAPSGSTLPQGARGAGDSAKDSSSPSPGLAPATLSPRPTALPASDGQQVVHGHNPNNTQRGATTQKLVREETAVLGGEGPEGYKSKPWGCYVSPSPTATAAMSLTIYMERLVLQMYSSETCLLIAISLMRRYRKNVGDDFPFTTRTVHRLLLACYVLAAKNHEERYYGLSYYAKVGGIPVDDLRAMELQAFAGLDFNCHVGPEEYRGVLLSLQMQREVADGMMDALNLDGSGDSTSAAGGLGTLFPSQQRSTFVLSDGGGASSSMSCSSSGLLSSSQHLCTTPRQGGHHQRAPQPQPGVPPVIPQYLAEGGFVHSGHSNENSADSRRGSDSTSGSVSDPAPRTVSMPHFLLLQQPTTTQHRTPSNNSATLPSNTQPSTSLAPAPIPPPAPPLLPSSGSTAILSPPLARERLQQLQMNNAATTAQWLGNQQQGIAANQTSLFAHPVSAGTTASPSTPSSSSGGQSPTSRISIGYDPSQPSTNSRATAAIRTLQTSTGSVASSGLPKVAYWDDLLPAMV